VLAGALIIAFVVALTLVSIPVVHGDSSDENLKAFGHLSAVFLLGLLTFLIRAAGADVKALVVGQDNRLSTSKLQAMVWTYAIAAALLSLVMTKFGGFHEGYDALIKHKLQDEYLILLGGPFAAAVIAKGIVVQKAASGDVSKTEGVPKLSQAVSDDAGKASLFDTQYLLFNFVALVYFIGAFVTHAQGGLPNIPGELVALTSVAAGTYVSNKAVLKQTPVIDSIVPATAAQGTTGVTLYGKWLVLPKQSADGQIVFEPPQVMFNGTKATVTDSQSTSTGSDLLTVTVPATTDVTLPPKVHVEAVNAAGVKSNAHAFTITA
jgi:hypothetical protein